MWSDWHLNSWNIELNKPGLLLTLLDLNIRITIKVQLAAWKVLQICSDRSSALVTMQLQVMFC